MTAGFYRRALTLVAVIALTAPSAVTAQATINIPTNGTTVEPFGKSGTQTYGQTFHTPDAINTWLTDFSFYFATAEPALSFRAFLYQWDPTAFRITGGPLFSGSIMTAASTGRQQVNTGGVLLTAGQQYVAMFNSTDISGSGENMWAFNDANPYAGGDFVFFNHDDGEFDRHFSERWSTFQGELQFTANFATAPTNVVPEPSTMLLMSAGLAGLVVFRRRRLR